MWYQIVVDLLSSTGRRWNCSCAKDGWWLVRRPAWRQTRDVSSEVCGNNWGSPARNGITKSGKRVQFTSFKVHNQKFLPRKLNTVVSLLSSHWNGLDASVEQSGYLRWEFNILTVFLSTFRFASLSLLIQSETVVIRLSVSRGGRNWATKMKKWKNNLAVGLGERKRRSLLFSFSGSYVAVFGC